MTPCIDVYADPFGAAAYSSPDKGSGTRRERKARHCCHQPLGRGRIVCSWSGGLQSASKEDKCGRVKSFSLAFACKLLICVRRLNGFNPCFAKASFEIPFEVLGGMLELVFARFCVFEGSGDEDETLGKFCISLGALQPGEPLHYCWLPDLILLLKAIDTYLSTISSGIIIFSRRSSFIRLFEGSNSTSGFCVVLYRSWHGIPPSSFPLTSRSATMSAN